MPTTDVPVASAPVTPSTLSSVAQQLSAGLGLKERYLMRYRPFICPFHRLLEHIPSRARLLDVGCGNGLWLLLLASLGRLQAGLGVEVSPRRIRAAQQLGSGFECLKFQRVLPDAAWPGWDCDCISIVDVLHHVPPAVQPEFLARIGKTSARRVIFKDIDPHDRWRATMNTLHDLVLSRELPRYCPADRAAASLEASGFRIIHRESIKMLWYPHYLLVGVRD